jgi:hypothetical protein
LSRTLISRIIAAYNSVAVGPAKSEALIQYLSTQGDSSELLQVVAGAVSDVHGNDVGNLRQWGQKLQAELLKVRIRKQSRRMS